MYFAGLQLCNLNGSVHRTTQVERDRSSRKGCKLDFELVLVVSNHLFTPSQQKVRLPQKRSAASAAAGAPRLSAQPWHAFCCCTSSGGIKNDTAPYNQIFLQALGWVFFCIFLFVLDFLNIHSSLISSS